MLNITAICSGLCLVMQSLQTSDKILFPSQESINKDIDMSYQTMATIMLVMSALEVSREEPPCGLINQGKPQGDDGFQLGF